ncbi:hypothetical protein ES703_122425 [subsurface metagenome]
MYHNGRDYKQNRKQDKTPYKQPLLKNLMIHDLSSFHKDILG